MTDTPLLQPAGQGSGLSITQDPAVLARDCIRAGYGLPAAEEAALQKDEYERARSIAKFPLYALGESRTVQQETDPKKLAARIPRI